MQAARFDIDQKELAECRFFSSSCRRERHARLSCLNDRLATVA
jgi:hypothetical protein